MNSFTSCDHSPFQGGANLIGTVSGKIDSKSSLDCIATVTSPSTSGGRFHNLLSGTQHEAARGRLVGISFCNYRQRSLIGGGTGERSRVRNLGVDRRLEV